MAKIRIMKDARYAPCAFLLVRANEAGVFDLYDESNTMLVQLDYDFPSLARDFGWDMREDSACAHSGTDGTIDCPDCGKTALAFITEASEWLHDFAGGYYPNDTDDDDAIDDPGYFPE